MEQIFLFLERHFDFIVMANVIWLAAVIMVIVMIRLRESVLPFGKWINTVFYYFVLGGEVVLVTLMAIILADNLRTKQPLDFSSRVLGSTAWVTEPLQIYFISDNNLITVRADGKDRRVLFAPETPIQSYHFSPDGKYLIFVTLKDLFLHDLRNGQTQRLDSWWPASESAGTLCRGSIDGVAWSPKSDQFCYRLGRWTNFSNQEYWKIYDLKTNTPKMINSPTRSLHALAWDEDGQNLYYSWFSALDKSVRGNPFDVQVFQIPLTSLTPKMVLQFPLEEPVLSMEHLAVRGIKIFSPKFPLSFSRDQDYGSVWNTKNARQLSIDDQDQLTYTKGRWWRRRLFQVPRLPVQSQAVKGQKGPLAIRYLRWFPSERYVIMEHDFFGVLILEPATGKIGILVNDKGNGFGWFATSTGRR